MYLRPGLQQDLPQAKNSHLHANGVGVTIKAAKDEKVVLSGADLVTGWKRQGDKWAAALPAKPVRVLKDGQPLAEFAFDAEGKSLVVSGFVPRLHVMETVVRQHDIDPSAGPGVKIEGVEIVNPLAAPAADQAK